MSEPILVNPPQVGFDYMASPYSHSDPLVMELRYLHTSKVLADRLNRGEWTYSPIVHCHELAKIWSMPKDAKFWERYDFAMIGACRHLLILRLEGWDQSVGVALEKAYAEKIGKHVYYI